MAKIKRIVTSEVEGRNLSDFYGDNSLAMDTNGVVNYYGPNEMGPLIGPGVVYGANHDSGDGYGYNTLKLIPHAPDGSVYDDRFIVVDPTAPNHIHLRAGGAQDGSNADLFLGAEKTNVVVSDSGRNVKIHSRQPQQSMAHLNINNEGNDYLLTTDVVSAVPGWTAEVNGIRYTVAEVTYPQEGQTLIYVPSAPFAFQGVYNFFSPDVSNELTFDNEGNLIAGQDLMIGVNAVPGRVGISAYNGTTFFYSEENPNSGVYIQDNQNPNQRVATVGYVDDSIPQPLSGTDSPTFDKVITTHNGDGTNVKIGDDAWIGDVNVANQIAIVGVQEPSDGGLLLGNTGTGSIVAEAGEVFIASSGAMTIEAVGGDMNFYMDGGMYIGDSASGNQIVKMSQLDSYISPAMVRYQPTFAATGLAFTGTGTTYPTYNSYYTKAGKMVTFVIEVDLSTVTNFGTGQYTLELPFDPAIGYNHFSGWAQVDTNVNPDVPNGHVILNVDHAGITSTLDLHYLKQAGGAHTPIIEGLFLQGTPVTLTTSSKIYVNGTYISA